MSPLTFHLRKEPPAGVDVSTLVPHRLADISLGEIERLPLRCRNRTLDVGELFSVRGSNAMHVVFENAHAKLHRIGAGLAHGRISVQGNAGDELGFAMTGGEMMVSGNAGSFAGCEMQGGEIHIEGSTGDFLGAALPGNKQGMRGGLIRIKGNAGDRAADHMRRGLILIEGNAGAYLGSRMLAGTVLVKGEIGEMPGFALKRGTLILSRAARQIPAYFNDCGTHGLQFLTLLDRDLRAKGGLDAFLPLTGQFQRWCGDLATGAHGEILIRAR